MNQALCENCDALAARVASLETALRYYADRDSWTKEEAIVPDDEDDVREVFAIVEDDVELLGDWMCETPRPWPGKHARAALSAPVSPAQATGSEE